MGIIYCKIHGEAGVMPYVSNAIFDHFIGNEKTRHLKVIVVSIFIKIDDENMIEQKYYFTDEEYKYFSLKDSYTIQTEEDESKLNAIMKDKFHPMCGQCFKEYMTEIGCSDYLKKL